MAVNEYYVKGCTIASIHELPRRRLSGNSVNKGNGAASYLPVRAFLANLTRFFV
jgi:hypothetical protein